MFIGRSVVNASPRHLRRRIAKSGLSLLPPGEGAAQRRMRVRPLHAQHGDPHPAYGHLLPGGEGWTLQSSWVPPGNSCVYATGSLVPE